MGHSSLAGFWIPKKPAEVVHVTKPVTTSRKRKNTGTGFGRGRPSGGRPAGANRGRPSKPAAQEAAEEMAESEADGNGGMAMEEVPVSLVDTPPHILIQRLLCHLIWARPPWTFNSLQDSLY